MVGLQTNKETKKPKQHKNKQESEGMFLFYCSFWTPSFLTGLLCNNFEMQKSPLIFMEQVI